MFHTVIIAGNVGRDAEMRYIPSGQAVASFSVATNSQYTAASGEVVKETLWFRVSAWGKMAEICNQYVKKGMKVLVEGRLKGDANGGPRIWTANDGTPRASFELTSSTVRFLSKSGDYTENAQEAVAPKQDAGDMLPPEDDIPF